MSEHSAGIISEVAKAIQEHARFLLATHIRPDGDALGSLLALASILHSLGKSAYPYCQDPIPPAYEFLPDSQAIASTVADPSQYDAAILVDCGDYERVGQSLAQSIRGIPYLINIDHHYSSTPFGDVSWVRPEASSTCEMLFDLCAEMKVALDKDLATQLYTGLLTDTGSFRFTNTSRRVLEIVTELVGAGAEPAHIADQIYDSAPPQRLRLLAKVLSTVEFLAQNRIATAEITQAMFSQTATSPVDSEGFINQLRSVKSVEMAIIFREGTGGTVYVSMRSKGDVDVASLAQKYGGGGHRRAAACRIEGDLNSIRARFSSEAESHLP